MPSFSNRSASIPSPQSLTVSDTGPDRSFQRSLTSTSSPYPATATQIYVTVHGHFYQPPRENPYLESVDRQSGASPFHNWNERIYWECYRPNAFARVLSQSGKVLAIVNNFEYLNFNVGPTLLSWLERYDSEVYQLILEGDRRSQERCGGHGNAIAQAYNHLILPLANPRDKQTQIRWGIADFKYRFGRDPEGLWLPETAVDHETLNYLVAEGIRFIILSPSQAQRCRPLPSADLPDPPWLPVGGGQIDPNRPYRCFVDDPSGDERQSGSKSPKRSFIDIFFFDGPISRDLGFGDLLASSTHLADRCNLAIKGDHRVAQIIGLATDGETFGHHKTGGEKCLAYAFTHTFPERGWVVTNYAHYLSLHPPTWEVELKSVTAWSCQHGVDRWQDDCGCGRTPTTHQRWRKPLRQSLDWLRDRLADIFETEGTRLFKQPWEVRDAYITILLDSHATHRRPEQVGAFLQTHQAHELKPEEQVDALRLLEMQRHAMLMYTSCGWFFEELSRPEGVQILCYAARALTLAGEVTGQCLEAAFIEHLSHIPTNNPELSTGAMVYQHLVQTCRITPEQVAAHYAISSLFSDRGIPSLEMPPVPSLSAVVSADILPTLHQQHLYCYTVYREDYQIQRLGSLTLGIGQIRLVSDLTWETTHLIFAVLHLGAWDFHCCVQPFMGRLNYAELKQSLFEVFTEGSSAHIILAMNRILRDPAIFSLQDLFSEERHRLMRLLTEDVLNRLNELYTQVYRVNYGVLVAFHRDGLPVPHELQVAAEVALTNRLLATLRQMEEVLLDASVSVAKVGQHFLQDLEEFVPEAEQLQCQFHTGEAQQLLERIVNRVLWQLLQTTAPDLMDLQVRYLERLLQVAYRLRIKLSLAKAQELFYGYLEALWRFPPTQQNSPQSPSQRSLPASVQALVPHLSKLGELLWVELPYRR